MTDKCTVQNIYQTSCTGVGWTLFFFIKIDLVGRSISLHRRLSAFRLFKSRPLRNKKKIEDSLYTVMRFTIKMVGFTHSWSKVHFSVTFPLTHHIFRVSYDISGFHLILNHRFSCTYFFPKFIRISTISVICTGLLFF